MAALTFRYYLVVRGTISPSPSLITNHATLPK
jgi:hypothetical protein